MTKPSKKELEKLTKANEKAETKVEAKPATKVKPALAAKTATPAKKAAPPAKKAAPAKKVVAAKKVLPAPAPAKKTTRQEHKDLAKVAYQHLHEEEKFSKPDNIKANEPLAAGTMKPSIPVHSVAIAPNRSVSAPEPFVPSNDPLAKTKDGKLKWADLRAKLNSEQRHPTMMYTVPGVK